MSSTSLQLGGDGFGQKYYNILFCSTRTITTVMAEHHEFLLDFLCHITKFQFPRQCKNPNDCSPWVTFSGLERGTMWNIRWNIQEWM